MPLMKTIATQTQISADGILRLELSTNLPPGPAEVIVVVQSSAQKQRGSTPSVSGLFASESDAENDVIREIRQLRRETTEASWELAEQ